MLYFREEEKRLLRQFYESESDRAMAVYGRRRTGKTQLMMEFYHSFEDENPCVYYQCASFDYRDCLKDFIELLKPLTPDSLLLERMLSFREVFQLKNSIFGCGLGRFHQVLHALLNLVGIGVVIQIDTPNGVLYHVFHDPVWRENLRSRRNLVRCVLALLCKDFVLFLGDIELIEPANEF